MLNINPLLLVGGVIGAVTALLIFAYASVKDKKTAMGFERTMADGEILRRLFAYAKPYWAKFLLVLFLMLFSIAYDIISPLIVGAISKNLSPPILPSAACSLRSRSMRGFWCSRWQAPIFRRSFCSGSASASSPTCARTCSPTLSPSPTSSSTRSRWASWLPALPTTPTPSR